MSKHLSGFLVFCVGLILGISSARVQSLLISTPKPIAFQAISTRSIVIESVPRLAFPESLKKFNAPEFEIRFNSEFRRDGTISLLHLEPTFFYKVSVPLEPRYSSFPENVNRQFSTSVQREVAELVAAQIKGIKFKPGILGGKYVDERVYIIATFRIRDAYAPRISSMPDCNEIELRFIGDSGWTDKVDADSVSQCYSF